MNKLITFLVILVALIGGAFGTKHVIAANKAAEEKRVLWLALHYEKTDRYGNVVAKAINTLETRLESIEKGSRFRPSSLFLEDKDTPSVFRYRLKCTPLPYLGEKGHCQRMLMEIREVIECAVRFGYLIKAYPEASQMEIIRHNQLAEERRVKDYDTINQQVNADLISIFRAQDTELDQIDSLTTDDFPEYRIEWERISKSK